jgi:long-chain fatty acid transport protein
MASSLALPSAALASGFSIFEQGAKASAMGGAFAAIADDPSAMFYNVAGIAYQRDLAATVGATMITFNNEFRGGEYEFPGPGTSAFYENHTFVIPNAYAVIPIGENLTAGLASFTAFGLRTDWEDGARFPGRFISQDANLKSASVQPSLAWKTTDDRFAIGAGLEYRISSLSLERNNAAVNPFTQRIVDVAHARLESDHSSGIGYNVGLMFRPSEQWRFGFQYRSDMDIDYEGDATFQQISTGNAQLDAIVARQLPPDQEISTTLRFPGFITGAVATKVGAWDVEFDLVYATWSRFDRLQVEFEQTPAANLDIIENYEDSMSYRLGGNRSVTDRWDVRLGALYDETPQPVEVVGPLLPDSNRVGITFGLGYRGEHWRVDLSEMVLIFEDRDTLGRSVDNFNGIYKTTANLFSLNVGYEF